MKEKGNNVISICYGIVVFIMALMQTRILKEYYVLSLILKYLLICIVVIAVFIGIGENGKIKYNILPIYVVFMCIVVFNIIKNDLSTDLIYIVVFMFLCRNITREKIMKSYCYGIMAVIMLTLVFWKFGMISSYFNGNRAYLGFNYTTFGPNLFLHACLALIVWKKEKISLVIWGIILFMNVWFFKRTDTLSVYIFTWILFLVYFVLKLSLDFRSNNVDRKRFRIISYLPFVLSIFTIIIQLVYDKYYYLPVFDKLNELLSYRLSLGKTAMNKYGFSLFGNLINWKTQVNSQNGYFYIDSSYLQILFTGGIVLLIVVCILMYIVCKAAVMKKDYYLILALTIFLIHCIADPQLLSFRYNPFLITVIYSLSEVKNIKNYNEIADNFKFKVLKE